MIKNLKRLNTPKNFYFFLRFKVFFLFVLRPLFKRDKTIKNITA